MEPAATAPAPPARLWTLDVLRGSCALAVYLSHWHLWSQFPPRTAAEHWIRTTGEFGYEAFKFLTWPLGANHPAVLAFFVLSGFCIHYPRARHRTSRPAPIDWPNYFRRRFWRIMPVYWTAALCGVAFLLAERLHPSGDPLLALHATGTPTDIAIRAAGLTGLYPHEVIAGNLTLNTVGVELVMYACYPLIVGGVARFGWTAVGAVFLALHLLTLPLLRVFDPFWLFNSALMMGIVWFAGAAAAQWFAQPRRRFTLWWLGLAWVLFLFLNGLPYFYGLGYLKQAAWVAVCLLIVLSLAGWEMHRLRPPTSRLIRGLRGVGTISYSLYAVHTPIMLLVVWALIVLAHRTDYFLQMISVLTASLTASIAVWLFVERRFYPPRRPSQPTAAAAMSTRLDHDIPAA